MISNSSWLTEYLGARWVRVDFHLHSPGSNTFRCPSGLDKNNPNHRNQIVDKYVEELIKNGIQIAAITDYNGIRPEWFNPICSKASQNNITIFPGAELSGRVCVSLNRHPKCH